MFLISFSCIYIVLVVIGCKIDRVNLSPAMHTDTHTDKRSVQNYFVVLGGPKTNIHTFYKNKYFHYFKIIRPTIIVSIYKEVKSASVDSGLRSPVCLFHGRCYQTPRAAAKLNRY